MPFIDEARQRFPRRPGFTVERMKTAAAAVAANIPDDLYQRVTSERLPYQLLYHRLGWLALERGGETTLEDVQAAYAVWMSPLIPTHWSLRPLQTLSREQQASFEPWLRAVKLARVRMARKQ